MISKSIDSIKKVDIENLITNGVTESRKIEYKSELPGTTDENKKEFLFDASSFANAGGGDILFGIEALNGNPTVAHGVSANLDADKLRLDNLLRDCVEPRMLGVQFKEIDGFPHGKVLLIRIPQSWNAPHMVTFKNVSKFYSRNSAGKYQLDVTELRSAFLLSSTVTERIRRFRDERLGRIIGGDTPLKVEGDGKIILHIIPYSSIVSGVFFDVSLLMKNTIPDPIGHPLNGSRINLDGAVSYTSYQIAPGNRAVAYCQVFRNGIIESVKGGIVQDLLNDRRVNFAHVETIAIKTVTSCLQYLNSLGLSTPMVVCLSAIDLINTVFKPDGVFCEFPISLDRDIIILPDIVIDEETRNIDRMQIAQLLRPILDALWNTYGYERSFSYDEKGKWIGRDLQRLR